MHPKSRLSKLQSLKRRSEFIKKINEENKCSADFKARISKNESLETEFAIRKFAKTIVSQGEETKRVKVTSARKIKELDTLLVKEREKHLDCSSRIKLLEQCLESSQSTVKLQEGQLTEKNLEIEAQILTNMNLMERIGREKKSNLDLKSQIKALLHTLETLNIEARNKELNGDDEEVQFLGITRKPITSNGSQTGFMKKVSASSVEIQKQRPKTASISNQTGPKNHLNGGQAITTVDSQELYVNKSLKQPNGVPTRPKETKSVNQQLIIGTVTQETSKKVMLPTTVIESSRKRRPAEPTRLISVISESSKQPSGVLTERMETCTVTQGKISDKEKARKFMAAERASLCSIEQALELFLCRGFIQNPNTSEIRFERSGESDEFEDFKRQMKKKLFKNNHRPEFKEMLRCKLREYNLNVD